MPTANPIAVASFSSTPYTYNALLSDGDDVNSRQGNIASGLGVFQRGQIVKCDPATGAITVPTVETDCNAIIVNDVDATSAAQTAEVYLTGSVKADALIWPGALSHALISQNLRLNGMYVQTVIYTDGSLSKMAPTTAEEAEAKKHIEANKAAIEKAAKAVAEEQAKVKPADSSWSHLTPDEREQHPEYADNVAEPPAPAHEPHKGPGEQHSPAKK